MPSPRGRQGGPMSTVTTHRKAKWLGAVALAALIAGGTAGSVAQTAAPAQTQAPITVQAPQMPSFADVVERVKPAVVSVRVKTRQVADRGGPDGGPGFSGPDLPDGHPLQRFFREFRGGEGQFRDGPRGRGPGPDRRFGRQSQGSGFFVSADGYRRHQQPRRRQGRQRRGRPGGRPHLGRQGRRHRPEDGSRRPEDHGRGRLPVRQVRRPRRLASATGWSRSATRSASAAR